MGSRRAHEEIGALARSLDLTERNSDRKSRQKRYRLPCIRRVRPVFVRSFERIFLYIGIFTKERMYMDTRVAVIGIIVENKDSIAPLNQLLSQYRQYIIGRMGVPYHEKNISIISIAIDAPQDVINTLSGKIGRLPGVSARAAYSNV